MKKNTTLRLSFWAKSHRVTAITLIVISKITVGIIGLFLGTWAAVEGYILPLETKWLLGTVAAASILLYPAKRLKKHLGRATFYRRQKTMDGVLATLGFAILFFVGNLTPAWVASPNVVTNIPANVTTALSCLEKHVSEVRKGVVHSGKLQRWIAAKAKTKIERVISKMKGTADGSDAAVKIVISILLVIAALLLAYVVYALSCSLACSGQEAAAALVGIFGSVAIIIGLIFAIKAVWGNNKSSELDERHRN